MGGVQYAIHNLWGRVRQAIVKDSRLPMQAYSQCWCCASALLWCAAITGSHSQRWYCFVTQNIPRLVKTHVNCPTLRQTQWGADSFTEIHSKPTHELLIRQNVSHIYFYCIYSDIYFETILIIFRLIRRKFDRKLKSNDITNWNHFIYL